MIYEFVLGFSQSPNMMLDTYVYFKFVDFSTANSVYE